MDAGAAYGGYQAGDREKYMILAEKQREGYAVNFDVMYYAQSEDYDSIEEEIGKREGELIW